MKIIHKYFSKIYAFLFKLGERLVYLVEKRHVHSFRHIRNELLEINSRKRETLPFDKNMLALAQCNVYTFEYIYRIEGSRGFRNLYNKLFTAKKILEYSNSLLPEIDQDGFIIKQHIEAAKCALFHTLRNISIKVQIEILLQALQGKLNLYFIESGFICFITNVENSETPLKYRRQYTFLVDDRTFYFDALIPSRIEQYLNSDASRLDKTEHERVHRIINTILRHKISKSNYQPDILPKALQNNRKKVLLLDQSRKDASVTRGLANADTFANMLQAALTENQDADILIKVHPDSINRGKGSYYGQIKSQGRIVKINESVNPYTLLEAVDKVYVCSSQMGLEALLCGKEVHVFGMPIYAGWGLTHDRQTLERRTQKLTLEELVHALYIDFTVYMNPKSLEVCEVEEFLENFMPLIEEYKNITK